MDYSDLKTIEHRCAEKRGEYVSIAAQVLEALAAELQLLRKINGAVEARFKKIRTVNPMIDSDLERCKRAGKFTDTMLAINRDNRL